MNWRRYLLLALLGLLVVSAAAVFQSAPGYMDADYYHAIGLQVANGHGFSEPFLWNYLDNPAGLPHPSNAYWMPLASILSAAGAFLFGHASWTASRLGFLLVAALIPPLTAALAWSLSGRRDLAFISGLLAVFPAFYLPYLPVTDTFGLYMLLGGTFLLLLGRMLKPSNRMAFLLTAVLLGIIAGLMHLTRTDGLLWLLVALAAVVLFRKSAGFRFTIPLALALVFLGYLLVMTPWFIRNQAAFGSPLGPGSTKMLWLTSYEQLFAYPADKLTFSAWWQSGVGAILKARLWALGVNLERTLAEQGEIFLLPLILVGLWHLRKDRRIWLALAAWGLTLLAMSLAFPFAGARGGFFHSGSALQPLWWALAPLGLDRLLDWARRRRGWDAAQAGKLFQPALVVLAVLVSGFVFYGKLLSTSGVALGQNWSRENDNYARIAEYLTGEEGMLQNQIAMVADPPGFYLASGLSAIAIPDGDVETLMQVANRYDADYLVLEGDALTPALGSVYDDPDNQPSLIHVGDVGNAEIFYIHHP